MSEGLSLGVDHQMLANEYSAKAVDDSQALDDITERLTTDSLELSDGNEALVMIAAHAPEAIPTDQELEVLLLRIRETVLSYLSSNKGETKIEIHGMDTPVVDVGLEDYKQVLLVVKDRVLKAIRWLAKAFVSAYKRLSDRLGRLSVRLMIIERKLDSTSDNAIPTDVIKLPPTASMLALYGKVPANASEVMNAVNKVKWLFTTIHNDFTLFQNTFKRAMDTGTRAEVLEIIRDYLGHLTNRLNAKADSQRNGRLVFNQLPNNYIVEISQGDSFTDCWATINRTGVVDVVGQESRRPDRASLSRLVSEQRVFLKIVNELYGKVGSRLTTDFRNLVRDAERSLESNNTDNRTIESTVNWFTEQQNRLFYRSMVLACGSMSAAMDYCVVALRAANTGTEGLDDGDEFVGVGATNRLVQLDQQFAQQQTALDQAATGVTVLSAALESLTASDDPDKSIAQLLNLDLSPFLPLGNPLGSLNCDYAQNFIGDYPLSLFELLKDVDRDLDRFAGLQMNEFKCLLQARSTATNVGQKLLKRHGYLGEAGYVQYLLNDGQTPTSGAGIVEGARAGVHNLTQLLSVFRQRTQLVTAALSDSDILVSKLYQAVCAESPVIIPDMTFTGGFSVHSMTNTAGFGAVSVSRAFVDTSTIPQRIAIPAGEPGDMAELQELLVTLVQQDDGFVAHWQEINRLAQHTRHIQGILVDSMARCNQGRADQWLLDGVNYLTTMYSELRWQSRLLRDVMLYREALILAICFYQRTEVTDAAG